MWEEQFERDERRFQHRSCSVVGVRTRGGFDLASTCRTVCAFIFTSKIAHVAVVRLMNTDGNFAVGKLRSS